MIEVKIYYHDTDCGGVVYYANYLKYLEEARTEFFTEKGLSIKDLAESGTVFVVLRQEIEYKSPAFYGDIVQISTRITSSTPVRIEFEHEIKRPDGRLICFARTLTACVSDTLKPKPIPEEVKTKLL